jgi:hypothetical protein
MTKETEAPQSLRLAATLGILSPVSIAMGAHDRG